MLVYITIETVMTRFLQKSIFQPYARRSASTIKPSTPPLQIPFLRPSLFYIEMIERKYPTFQEKCICLREMEQQPIYYDFKTITTYYMDAFQEHATRYQHYRTSKPLFYKKEKQAHHEFVDGIYAMSQFRLFVSTIMEYVYSAMPIHLSYYTYDSYQSDSENADDSHVDPLERKRRAKKGDGNDSRKQQQYTLGDVVREEEEHKNEIMLRFQMVPYSIQVLDKVDAETWMRYMRALFGPYEHPYTFQNTMSKTNHGQLFMRMVKVILGNLGNVRTYLETSGYDGEDEADSEESLDGMSGKNGVHMDGGEKYVPVTSDIIANQEVMLNRWMDSMTGYLTSMVNAR